MAYNNWTYSFGVKTGGIVSGVTSLDILTPIAGVGSLRSTHTSGTTDYQTMQAFPTALSHGHLSGRLQTLIRATTIDGMTPTDISSAGVLALQSDVSMVYDGQARHAYLLTLRVAEGYASHRLSLYKLTHGLNVETDLPSGELLLSVLNPFTSFTVGSVCAIELVWRADTSFLTQLGGVLLIARAGPNIAGLTDKFSYLDATSPYTTTVGEGLATTFKSSSGASQKVFDFDQTTLIKIIP